MMQIILFDQPLIHQQLLPLTFTRPISELRIGILTLKEKWEKRLDGNISYSTADYLTGKYQKKMGADNLFINGSVVANDAITAAINNLQMGEYLIKEETLIAARLPESEAENIDLTTIPTSNIQHTTAAFILVTRPYHIFQYNSQALSEDFQLLTQGRTSQPLSATNTVLGDASNIFLEEGASVECAILNVKDAPIYVGKNAEIMEGCIVRNGLGMAENSVLKMGAKIYGATTLGTFCKVGGEVNNSVLLGYSNKGHDGFLGNSVLGEWCNLGADTNNSNLKNNYQPVRLWDYTTKRFGHTGLQFCGLIAGDHSKSGINTMFNTGTVLGISCNIYGGGFPRNFIPSFAWGGAAGYKTYRLDKALETAEMMMARRKQELTQVDIDMMNYIFETSAKSRFWEKSV